MMNNDYLKIYTILDDYFGPQHWWPGQSPFEIMVGAILTQNTSWSNVAVAIDSLRASDLLHYDRLCQLTAEEIAPLIRPCGYYNLKAKRLKNLLNMIATVYRAKLDDFLQDSLDSARKNLLRVKGIGPETADSILLYAAHQPVFVVDAYTHRVFSRHNMADEETDYQTLQAVFIDNLPDDVQLYNQYHALIVRVASRYCKKTKPLCEQCPLQGYNL